LDTGVEKPTAAAAEQFVGLELDVHFSSDLANQTLKTRIFSSRSAGVGGGVRCGSIDLASECPFGVCLLDDRYDDVAPVALRDWFSMFLGVLE
jgi:hypothetical protein